MLYMYMYCLNVDIKLKWLHLKYHRRLSLSSLIMVTSHLEDNDEFLYELIPNKIPQKAFLITIMVTFPFMEMRSN